MSIPPFTKEGLLPPGFHTAEMAEFEKKLGFSAKRRFLIDSGLKIVTHELRKVGIEDIYIDGSFVSTKLSPDDIDGYVLVHLRSSDILNLIINRSEIWRAQYQMDIYPGFTDLKGEGSKSYWESWFGHTDDIPPKNKGIIRLVIGG